MSDKDIDQAPPAEEETAEDVQPVEQDAAQEAPPAEKEEPAEKPAQPKRGGGSIAWLSFVVAILALAIAGYVAWQGRQAAQDTATEDRVARLETRVTGSTNSLGELEGRIDELGQRDPGIDAELDALRREFEERISLLSSLPARISTLESSVASLAGISEGARDAWVLAEAEYYMQIANAQLQLANNPQLAALALRMADERIVQLANPGLTDVRRALSDELAALDVMEKPDIEKAKEYVLHCRSGLMRMVNIITELLEFSRNTYTAFEYAPIDKIIADAVKAMEPTTAQVKIEITHKCTAQMPQLRSNNLFQVFCNLIKNASDAMNGEGQLNITTKLSDGNFLVEFRDTGPGFPPENAQAMFEPFFTTKNRGRGTGLGLAICKDIVEKYNGKITAKNAPQTGGIFTVFIPLTNKTTKQPQKG